MVFLWFHLVFLQFSLGFLWLSLLSGVCQREVGHLGAAPGRVPPAAVLAQPRSELPHGAPRLAAKGARGCVACGGWLQIGRSKANQSEFGGSPMLRWNIWGWCEMSFKGNSRVTRRKPTILGAQLSFALILSVGMRALQICGYIAGAFLRP